MAPARRRKRRQRLMQTSTCSSRRRAAGGTGLREGSARKTRGAPSAPGCEREPHWAPGCERGTARGAGR
eukprot:2524479-Pleurochrysis_carterae.AAC.4